MPYRDDDDLLRSRHQLLSHARIATPCDASWEAMAGDDRVRHCALCDRSVYDLAAMTSAEAVALLQLSRESRPCVRLHRRRDGTVITSDCTRGIRQRRRRLAVIAATAVCGASIAAAGEHVADALTPAPVDPATFVAPSLTMGTVAFDDAETRDRDREEDIRRATEQVDAMLMDTTSGLGRIATLPSDPDDR